MRPRPVASTWRADSGSSAIARPRRAHLLFLVMNDSPWLSRARHTLARSPDISSVTVSVIRDARPRRTWDLGSRPLFREPPRPSGLREPGAPRWSMGLNKRSGHPSTARASAVLHRFP